MRPVQIQGGNGRRYRVREVVTYQLEVRAAAHRGEAWIPLGAPSKVLGDCQRMALTIEREIGEDGREQEARP